MAEFNINNLSDRAKGALFNQLESIASGGEVIVTSELTDDAVTSDKLNPNTIKVAEVSLSAADIIALNTTPITLVAAVADKTIVVDDVCLKMTTTATQFANGGALEFRYTDGSGDKVTADIAAAVVTAAAGTSFTINKSIVTSLTGVVASPIVITNASAAFDTGTGTATVTVRYHLI